jgi:Spy/CpxP family protein refolding chaperone
MAGIMLRKKNVLIFVLAILAISAGMVLGWVWTPLQRFEGARAPHNPRPWFDQLALSSDQQQQMDKIWTDARQKRQKMFERFRDLDKQREEQVQGLLSPDQRTAYEKIVADYRAGREQLSKERETLLNDANAKSRALLDDSQKAKWDILSKEMRSRRGQGNSATQHSTTMRSQDESREESRGEQDHHY